MTKTRIALIALVVSYSVITVMTLNYMLDQFVRHDLSVAVAR